MLKKFLCKSVAKIKKYDTIGEKMFEKKEAKMIAYLNGILELKFNGFVVIDVAGVGYKVFMSEASISELGEIGDKVKVYTHYHVREDDISLYGFLTIEELNMFELLISVSGVGAKSALNTLANIEASSFALAVVSNDTSKLTKIPGIGAKTAKVLAQRFGTLDNLINARHTHIFAYFISSMNDCVYVLIETSFTPSLKSLGAA